MLYPANGYDFDAADVAAYLAGLTSGVFSSAEDFPVTAAGGLKVTVGAGRGWVHLRHLEAKWLVVQTCLLCRVSKLETSVTSWFSALAMQRLSAQFFRALLVL